jgi:hypothetical protein
MKDKYIMPEEKRKEVDRERGREREKEREREGESDFVSFFGLVWFGLVLCVIFLIFSLC